MAGRLIWVWRYEFALVVCLVKLLHKWAKWGGQIRLIVICRQIVKNETSVYTLVGQLGKF